MHDYQKAYSFRVTSIQFLALLKCKFFNLNMVDFNLFLNSENLNAKKQYVSNGQGCIIKNINLWIFKQEFCLSIMKLWHLFLMEIYLNFSRSSEAYQQISIRSIHNNFRIKEMHNNVVCTLNILVRQQRQEQSSCPNFYCRGWWF